MKKNQTEKRYSFAADTWRRLCKSKLAMLGVFILVVLVVCAVFADFIAPYAMDAQNLNGAYQLPTAAHWFGTDEYGRDIFSRCIFGARISLVVGFIAVGFAIVAGVLLGSIAGYYGGKLDNLIMRVMDVLMSIPQMLLAISISAALGSGLFNLMLAVALPAPPAMPVSSEPPSCPSRIRSILRLPGLSAPATSRSLSSMSCPIAWPPSSCRPRPAWPWPS